VAQHIRQPFLHNAEDCNLNLVATPAQIGIHVQRHANPAALLKSLRQPRYCLRQPGLSQQFLQQRQCELRMTVRRPALERGAECVPDLAGRRVIWADDLPKTRSGKIMRRLLRDIAEGKALGDTTTLADPSVVARLKEQYQDEH
jgi:acyl-CoA synthetase (AMP-forming)/AMP-acid ligase II